MDFTREPIIETIITPKEGCKIVVRSSKGVAQEEYFVDAVQVVSFGNAFFFRSLERPKAFLVPVADYEILEVREARMVLKNVGVERTIKIGGGREGGGGRPPRQEREREREREPAQERAAPAPAPALAGSDETAIPVGNGPADGRGTEKKRDRRRQGRRRRGRDDRTGEAPAEQGTGGAPSEDRKVFDEDKREVTTVLTSILPPPSQLISETLQQYRGNELFKDIFSRPIEPEPQEGLPSPVAEQVPGEENPS